MFAISSSVVVASVFGNVALLACGAVALYLVAQLAFAVGYTTYAALACKYDERMARYVKNIWLNPCKYGNAYARVWFLLAVLTVLTCAYVFRTEVQANDIQVLASLAAVVFGLNTLLVNFVGSVQKYVSTKKQSAMATVKND